MNEGSMAENNHADIKGICNVLKRADNVVANRYYFTKTWDMERCAVPFEVDVSLETLSGWEIIPNGDPEWCFMFNRMDYLDDLCTAWLEVHKAVYAEKAVALMLQWVKAHTDLAPGPSTRTLDMGVRISAMARALSVLKGSKVLDTEQASKIKCSIGQQIEYMRDNYLPKYETSNWGLIQTLSILSSYARLSEHPENERFWQWAYKRAELQLAAQSYPDGTNWELSVMYQAEILLYALQTKWILERKRIDLPKGLENVCLGFSHTLAMMSMPDGRTEALGDSDRHDAKTLLALASAVLEDSAIKWTARNVSLDPLDVYAFGTEIIERYDRLDARCPAVLSLDAYDSGIFVTRSSWNQNANATVFLDGPMGSGHGHCDELHLSLWYDGRPVLTDSGRYSYREDVPDRTRLKSVRAHNVPTIDGRSSSEPRGSWDYAGFSYPLKPYVCHRDGLDYWEGAIIESVPTSVVLRRVVCMDHRAWIVIDQAWCDGNHELKTAWHFDSSIHVVKTEDGLMLGDIALLMHTESDYQITRDTYSELYNTMLEQDVLVTRAAFKDFGVQISVIAPQDVSVEFDQLEKADGAVFASSLARSIKLGFPDGVTRTLAVVFQEVYSGIKALLCDGVPYHAGVAVVTRKCNETKLDVLRG
jgi:hypothetical protein